MPILDNVLMELFYSLVIVGLSLAVFLKTNDIYSLSRHRGIYHFRNIFLYFSLAFLFRMVHVFVTLYDVFLIRAPLIEANTITLFLVGYFSTMAILSVVVTFMIRSIRLENDHLVMIMNAIAIMVSLSTAVFRSTFFLGVFHGAILLISVFILLMRRKDKHAHMLTYNRMMYMLLLSFWILNTLTIGRWRGFFDVGILVYVISTVIFVSVFLRVRNRLFAHAEKKGKARDHK